MKKYLLILIIAGLYSPATAQVVITPGAQWVNSGNVVITLQDINLENNGTFTAGNSTVKFTGSAATSIGGSSTTSFHTLEVGKTGSNTLNLLSDIAVNNKVGFLSGLLNLNQKNLFLAPTAFLENENENSRVSGTNGGYVEITQELNTPGSSNPGNLGAIISSTANLGPVIIRRGHMTQNGTGLTTGIHRYFNIMPANNESLNATVRLTYFDAELNSQSENNLVQFKSVDNGLNWINQSFTSRDAATNYVEKTGHSSMSIFTLANDNSQPPPVAGVTGLVFTASRKKPAEVQLKWTTQTESNMNGYEVQRRLKNEANFSVRSFVNTQAPGGNSNILLSYNYTDANSYTDTSYYRLRIVDNNGGSSYSEVRAVAAKTNGGGNGGGGNGNGNGNNREINDAPSAKPVTPAFNETSAQITVGPNPNNGNFWFMVSGIEKETTATLYTIDGKILKQFRVMNQQRQQVSGLGNGMYLLKVPGIDAFRIVVQGSSNSSPVIPITTSSTKY